MSENCDLNDSENYKDKVFNLKDVLSPEFYKKMSEVSPEINRLNRIDFSFFAVLLIMTGLLTLFFSMNYVDSKNIIFVLAFSFFVSYAIVYLVCFIYMSKKFKEIAIINYMDNEVNLSNLETDFPLIEINKYFKVEVKYKDCLDEDLIALINAGKERGGYYNYEVSILKSIKEIIQKKNEVLEI